MLFPPKKKPPGKLIRGGFLLLTVFTYSLTNAAPISAPTIITPAIAKGPQNGVKTHNQDQLITPVNFSATNNTPNKLITPFISIYFKLITTLYFSNTTPYLLSYFQQYPRMVGSQNQLHKSYLPLRYIYSQILYT